MSSSDLDRVLTTDALHFGKATDLADFDMAKRVGDMLNKHYPGYMWAVNVSRETGMITVQNFTLSGEWGFYLHYTKVLEDPDLKIVMRAGGEILERYKLSRGKANQDIIQELPSDLLGRIQLDRAGANQEW